MAALRIVRLVLKAIDTSLLNFNLVFKITKPDFRTLQVLNNRNWFRVSFAGFTNPLYLLATLFMCAMTEVKSYAVSASFNKI